MNEEWIVPNTYIISINGRKFSKTNFWYLLVNVIDGFLR
jgi:hypothetical protein